MGLEYETHYWYNRGYYSKSLQSLKQELTGASITSTQKSKIHYQIAYTYYAMSFVEDYKKHLDTANFIASKKNKFSIEDKIEYAIGMIRYYNYEIKPDKSLAIYNRIYPEFNRLDPFRKSKLWIKLYQNIATTRRNSGADYMLMNAEYDSAYLLIKKHNLLNSNYELDYCKSRGNMNLDKVNPLSNILYYNESIRFFLKAIQILKNQKEVNLPLLTGFYNSVGLVSYMRGELEFSKANFDKAYSILLRLKKYDNKDYQGVSLNTFNLSTLTMNLLFKKHRDIQLIQDQLQKLKSVKQKYKSYSTNNLDVDILVFTDMYGFSPYNAMVSCYNNLYEKTRNKSYLDSSFYYSEMNRTQWSNKVISYHSFQKRIRDFISDGYAFVQYGEYGIVHNTFAYAIIKNKLGTNYVRLGKINDLNSEKFNFDRWDVASYQKSLVTYLRFFKPIVKYIPKKTIKILVTKSPFLEKVNLESLIIDSIKGINKIPFLISKYPVFTQPSFRLYSENSKDCIRSVGTIFPNYSGVKKLSNIHFTKDELQYWIQHTGLEKVDYASRKGDILLIAAHGFSGTHRVDNAYLDKGYNQLTINNICKRRMSTKLTLLAVCDGGVGQSISSGSSFSLASAYLLAGSKSCVYSTWKLDDQIGAKIITSYLKRLENGEQKDWALRNAKLEYLRDVTTQEGNNPIYWAGLQVMGDVSSIEIGETNTTLWFIFVLVLVVVVLSLLFVVKMIHRLRSV